jgi:hypothetical protein
VKNTTVIERLYAEYSALWHGECDESIARRMMEIERRLAAEIPATLAEARMQTAVGLAATGSLSAGPSLAPKIGKAA